MTFESQAINKFRPLFAALTFVCFCPAQAAVITWGSGQVISGEGDVSNNGTSVAAYNVNGNATTVNGVDFQPFQATWPGGGGTATVGNFTLAGGYDVSAHSATSTSSVYTSLSAAYRDLVGTAASWIWFDLNLSMAGLTIGQEYEVQAWVNRSEDTRFLYGTGVDGALLSAGDSQFDGNAYVLSSLGQYVTGTFTADAATQNIVLAPDEVGIINGFQLRAVQSQSVPEPGSLALAALGLGGLYWSRRKSS